MKKRKILVIGTAPDNFLTENLNTLSKIFSKDVWEYHMFLTKNYTHDTIDHYINIGIKAITPDTVFNVNEFDKIIVCQPHYNVIDFLNVYMFLKNNNIRNTLVIFYDNKIIKRSLRNYTMFIYYFLKYFRILLHTLLPRSVSFYIYSKISGAHFLY